MCDNISCKRSGCICLQWGIKNGAKIVYYRKIRNLRQEELAEEASITPQYLSRIENGGYSKNVSLSTLMKIAGVLDCSAMIWY